MSSFSVPVVRISRVYDHPKADRLSINEVLGFQSLTRKRPDGSHLYKEGDLVVYVPEDAIIPEYLLKREQFWDDENDRGTLAGTNGNRVKCVCLRGVYSQGILVPVEMSPAFEHSGAIGNIVGENGAIFCAVRAGDDVADFLGITKRVITIPANMAGEVYACPYTVGFDFDSIQKQPDLFEEGELVEVTEKLHGTNFQAGVAFGDAWDDAFAEERNVYITSKGMGAEHKALKNNEHNLASNLYVRVLAAYDLPRKLNELRDDNWRTMPKAVRVFGEVYGQGVQDLSYGAAAPNAAIFDIKMDDEFLFPDDVRNIVNEFDMTHAPILYRGPFSMEKMIELRDGKTTMAGDHIREGIVIRSVSGKRKIAKFVSPLYLTRKGDVSEYQ